MSTVKITALTDENTCSFCKNALAKYSCPKCNQLYCTLQCYQCEQHLQCSEQFYKDMVQEHLESQLKDDNSKENKEKRMQEILQKFHQENQLGGVSDDDEEELDSDDEEDDPAVDDLGARLTGIDLDDSEAVWKHLTAEERKEFEKFLLSGDVAQFVTIWTPWWEFKSSGGILDEEEWDKVKRACPKLEKIQSFSEISGKEPAKCVENNMINILAAYTFLQRYFNGEVEEFSLEYSMFLWNLALNLKENVNFDTAAMAIESVFQQCINCVDLAITTDTENQRHVKEDVNSLLAGPHSSERKFYLLSALSDIKSTLSKGKTAKQNREKEEQGQSKGEFFEKFTAQQTKALKTFTKENIKSATRKIDYYLSFVHDIYLKSA